MGVMMRIVGALAVVLALVLAVGGLARPSPGGHVKGNGSGPVTLERVLGKRVVPAIQFPPDAHLHGAVVYWAPADSEWVVTYYVTCPLDRKHVYQWYEEKYRSARVKWLGERVSVHLGSHSAFTVMAAEGSGKSPFTITIFDSAGRDFDGFIPVPPGYQSATAIVVAAGVRAPRATLPTFDNPLIVSAPQ